MFSYCAKHTLMSVVLGLVSPYWLAAQTTTPSDSLFLAMPSVVMPQLVALGERVRFPGKEKIIFAGQYIDGSGNRPGQITYQPPGLVRLDGFKPGSLGISFDGERSYGASTAIDEAFLETFVMDTVEGMLAAIRRGGGLRLLGRQFQPNPKKFLKYTGPLFDIFELAAPVRSRQDQLVRMKRYYFDSKTGWLLRTRYRDRTRSPYVTVETRFSGWKIIEGSAYPARIDRLENGRPVFSFVVANISAEPRVEPAAFR